MRRLVGTLLLAVAPSAAAGALWLWWADNEYRGLDSCPFGVSGHGHPWLVALALMLGAGAVVSS
ncbi:MAG: hypothetical protein ACXVRS_09675 [Gaiellaceae bacterium]